MITREKQKGVTMDKCDLDFDRKVRINIFKQFRRPYNVWYTTIGVVMLIIWTAIIISHIIKGLNWFPLTFVYIGLIPFVLSVMRELE